MSEQSPLEPVARISSADAAAASETTSPGVAEAAVGEGYPTEVDDQDTFLSRLDDFLYATAQEEGL